MLEYVLYLLSNNLNMDITEALKGMLLCISIKMFMHFDVIPMLSQSFWRQQNHHGTWRTIDF